MIKGTKDGVLTSENMFEIYLVNDHKNCDNTKYERQNSINT